ncbi:DUF2785 domain-containing protein [Planococcus sp. CAU13]|uniref:DUF2785 domain-containing protein n=1 Tax=Planococcus sp. CAU13 TaxID=1541197 RepID=UPI00052FE540|nr:DUF2785 domain-containing protein [Planococcus sp. CAU13]
MNKTEFPALLAAGEVKSILKKIRSGEREWEEDDWQGLLPSMLKYIGSIDSELRDSLIYGTFCKLTNEKKWDNPLLQDVLNRCLTDEMLFNGIGENGTDSVFTRSFTTLLIALVLYSDNESPFLTAHAVDEAKRKMIDYMEAEKDLRGFVPGKGWAHSIAHAADVFDELAKSRYADQEMYEELLDELWKKAFVAESVYIHDEEERILIPILEMVKRGMDPEILQDRLDRLPAEMARQKEWLEEEKYWFLIANAKKFLKSFYVEMEDLPQAAQFRKSIWDCLAEL